MIDNNTSNLLNSKHNFDPNKNIANNKLVTSSAISSLHSPEIVSYKWKEDNSLTKNVNYFNI